MNQVSRESQGNQVMKWHLLVCVEFVSIYLGCVCVCVKICGIIRWIYCEFIDWWIVTLSHVIDWRFWNVNYKNILQVQVNQVNQENQESQANRVITVHIVIFSDYINCKTIHYHVIVYQWFYRSTVTNVQLFAVIYLTEDASIAP